MLIPDPIVAGAEALAAVKDFLRIDGTGEDAVLAALVATAIAQCESYTGTTMIERGFTQTIEATSWWRGLSASPVTAITGVADTSGAVLPVTSYAVDIDACGRGRLRLFGPAFGATSTIVRVAYRAGVASGWAAIAEPLRHGIVRMVAHLHQLRDQADALGPPATALALWQGARRMRLS